MNKRIRKKMAKRAAEHEEVLSPTAALQHAVEEFQDSAMHLLETALHELQRGVSSLVAEYRDKALAMIPYLKHGISRSSQPSEPFVQRRADRATA